MSLSPSETVSVIIPTYNGAHWVTAAVDSAFAQTTPPAQVIVIDDGSTDDTRARLAPYVSRGVHYVHQANAGVSAARNYGLSVATGSLVAFLDADDVWHPRKLEAQLSVLSARPELGLLATRTFDWPAPVTDLPGPAPSAFDELPWADLVVKNYFATSSIIVRREILRQVGPFDTALHGPEDHDLWLRIAERAKVGILTSPLTGYRSHAVGLGSRPRSMEDGMHRILAKLGERRAWERPGGGRLRRRARAHVHYSCAYLYGVAGHTAPAVVRVIRSLLAYPLPFARREVNMPLARPKLLSSLLLRALRLKSTTAPQSSDRPHPAN